MCTGKKMVFDCGCRSSDTLFPGLTQENMRELWSLRQSVSLFQGRHDFIFEYRPLRGFCTDIEHSADFGGMCLEGAPFWIDVPDLKLKTKYLHPSVLCAKPPCKALSIDRHHAPSY